MLCDIRTPLRDKRDERIEKLEQTLLSIAARCARDYLTDDDRRHALEVIKGQALRELRQ